MTLTGWEVFERCHSLRQRHDLLQQSVDLTTVVYGRDFGLAQANNPSWTITALFPDEPEPGHKYDFYQYYDSRQTGHPRWCSFRIIGEIIVARRADDQTFDSLWISVAQTGSLTSRTRQERQLQALRDIIVYERTADYVDGTSSKIINDFYSNSTTTAVPSEEVADVGPGTCIRVIFRTFCGNAHCVHHAPSVIPAFRVGDFVSIKCALWRVDIQPPGETQPLVHHYNIEGTDILREERIVKKEEPLDIFHIKCESEDSSQPATVSDPLQGDPGEFRHQTIHGFQLVYATDPG
ncbi:hypothetical protein B0H11DRAFT_2428386 [Mycena galericulata]|nr:hypothetical protein B0H11DRAFT_2428386 [Mycena galericulata]